MPPVVWVLKAKTKWVMPLKIIAQAKMTVTAMPETGGTRMAKMPARIKRTLRAMDQLMDFGESAESEVEVVLIRDSPKDVDTVRGRWAENSILGSASVKPWCRIEGL